MADADLRVLSIHSWNRASIGEKDIFSEANQYSKDYAGIETGVIQTGAGRDFDADPGFSFIFDTRLNDNIADIETDPFHLAHASSGHSASMFEGLEDEQPALLAMPASDDFGTEAGPDPVSSNHFSGSATVTDFDFLM